MKKLLLSIASCRCSPLSSLKWVDSPYYVESRYGEETYLRYIGDSAMDFCVECRSDYRVRVVDKIDGVEWLRRVRRRIADRIWKETDSDRIIQIADILGVETD